MHLHWFVPSFGDEARLGDPAAAVPPSLTHLTAVAQAAEAAGFEAMPVTAGEDCHHGVIVAPTGRPSASSLPLFMVTPPSETTSKRFQVV